MHHERLDSGWREECDRCKGLDRLLRRDFFCLSSAGRPRNVSVFAISQLVTLCPRNLSAAPRALAVFSAARTNRDKSIVYWVSFVIVSGRALLKRPGTGPKARRTLRRQTSSASPILAPCLPRLVVSH